MLMGLLWSLSQINGFGTIVRNVPVPLGRALRATTESFILTVRSVPCAASPQNGKATTRAAFACAQFVAPYDFDASPSVHSPERSFSSQNTPMIVFTSLMVPSFTQSISCA
jgi:hypothetical protein